ncbi:hypothetical protein CEXT_43591 [Caerostris extrusa]|uniref:Uncharacterized protein n=1 Tax=Caerostris extrusa TaxID=172846 RepID=A0AAV4NKM7_CAEEX|nr:hypothetical protein CEXT_43591 [Caerostris extrusa]
MFSGTRVLIWGVIFREFHCSLALRGGNFQFSFGYSAVLLLCSVSESFSGNCYDIVRLLPCLHVHYFIQYAMTLVNIISKQSILMAQLEGKLQIMLSSKNERNCRKEASSN